jgi:hypothetical protein
MENNGAMMTPRLPAQTALTPPAARLSLEPTRSRQRMLDGAWWPRSYDSETELSALIAALCSGAVAVARIGINRGAWESAPVTVSVDSRVVRIYWHGPQDIHAISVNADGGRRLDILVVPPDATMAEARAAMPTARFEPGRQVLGQPDRLSTAMDRTIAMLWPRTSDRR